ncbi:hypothetical protein M0802_008815 [Mischocyttarus mexicanus]|nr:hypothetical protein M0802_008815 [Mischocyttarus mexicanus]
MCERIREREIGKNKRELGLVGFFFGGHRTAGKIFLDGNLIPHHLSSFLWQKFNGRMKYGRELLDLIHFTLNFIIVLYLYASLNTFRNRQVSDCGDGGDGGGDDGGRCSKRAAASFRKVVGRTKRCVEMGSVADRLGPVAVSENMAGKFAQGSSPQSAKLRRKSRGVPMVVVVVVVMV